MRIKPVNRYRPPALPLAVWTKGDPMEHAARCGRMLRLMAGAGLLGSSWFAAAGGRASAADAPAEVPARLDTPPAPGADADTEATTPAETIETLFRVAPNLLDAMRREGLGRGAIGCVVMDPVSFITEEDGVALIRSEMGKAGLVLAEHGPEIPYVKLSIAETLYTQNHEPCETPKILKPFLFDGGTLDGRVVFKWVSESDVDAWRGVRHLAEFYDLPHTTEELAAGLAETPDAAERIVLLVCDPGHSWKEIHNSIETKHPWDTPEKYPARPNLKTFKGSYDEYKTAAAAWAKDNPEGEAVFRADFDAWHAENRRRKAEATLPQIQRQLAPQIVFLREQGILPPIPEATMEPEGALPITP